MKSKLPPKKKSVRKVNGNRFPYVFANHNVINYLSWQIFAENLASVP